ncbi:MAG: hypothetical protein KAT74_08475, partial [Candidatus Cloacimonetes bacterium]|nr:hypothetical protein [Candidatus Cloacimonadota bacterium]
MIRASKAHIYFLLIFLLFPFIVQAQMLDSLSTAMIDSCLSYLHLTREELGFEKAWAVDDTFKLEIVDYLLHNPLKLPGYVEQTLDVTDKNIGNPVQLFRFVAEQLDIKIMEKELQELAIEDFTFDPQNPFENLLLAISKAEPYRKRFYSALDSLELHDLIMAAPNMWADEEDSLDAKLKGSWQFEVGAYVDTSRTVDDDRILNIIKKLDREALAKTGIIFIDAVWKLKNVFESNMYQFGPVKGKIEGVQGEVLYFQQTDFGKMIIGGEGDNVYSRDFAVIIDIGGNDTYRCRAGGAIGELGNPFSLVLDLSGNDIYLAEEKAVTQGAGFLGIGTLIDCEGNDIYQGYNYSQGVGFFGIGLLYDNNGFDDYRAGFYSQGGGHVGIGFLMDNDQGDDRY